MADFSGSTGLGGLALIKALESRSISAENPRGERGAGGMAEQGTGARAARDLGRGWKISPSIEIAAGATATIAEIAGSGALTHLWLTTHPQFWRQSVLRFYWDGDARPAVEVPLGDFFCNGWGVYSHVASLPVAVNPNGGMNSYWEMPFRDAARITVENLAPDAMVLYYQVDYQLGAVAPEAAYFHARWQRSNPLPYGQVHTLLEGADGPGLYVGTYLAWGVNNAGWWGEGEVKFFMDGDDEYPTICGTGTEDYFGGAWNFDLPGQGYTVFTTPYLGLHQVLRPDGQYRSQQRFGMYRWHIVDPIRFAETVRVTIQALGWRSQGRYLPLQDDISSTAFWYARPTSTPGPGLPAVDALEVI